MKLTLYCISLLLISLFTSVHGAEITYTVTASSGTNGYKTGTVYYLDAGSGASIIQNLELLEGNTYNFDYSQITNHPFRLQTIDNNGAYSSANEYTNGVTINNNVLTIVVPAGAPDLYYVCANHAQMGGSITTTSAVSAVQVPAPIWQVVLTLAILITLAVKTSLRS